MSSFESQPDVETNSSEENPEVYERMKKRLELLNKGEPLATLEEGEEFPKPNEEE